MFKKLKNFICNLFNIKACQCDEDEHIEFYTKVPEPEIPVHEEVKLTKPMHCGSHLRYMKKCPACAATRN
tara:strand:+ start:302 stop:511 length:210 start_codon:yes stop_codon:yes gene_type:complete